MHERNPPYYLQVCSMFKSGTVLQHPPVTHPRYVNSAFIQRTLKYNDSHQQLEEKNSTFVLQFLSSRLAEILIETQGYNEPHVCRKLPRWGMLTLLTQRRRARVQRSDETSVKIPTLDGKPWSPCCSGFHQYVTRGIWKCGETIINVWYYSLISCFPDQLCGQMYADAQPFQRFPSLKHP